ncbi:hypothetical protein ABZ137_40665 [Streptomyces bobili]
MARERLKGPLTALAEERALPEQAITAPLHGPPGEQLIDRMTPNS